MTLASCTLPAPSATGNENDLFYLELLYDAQFPNMAGDTIQKNGNINQLMWRTRGRERQAYNFSYDYLNRLRSAVYADVSDAGAVTQSKNFNESLTYADARGNIATLRRQGSAPSGTCLTFGQIDNLTYTFTAGTNRLASISEAVTSTTYKNKGFNPGSGTGSYQYDANGNMWNDPYKGMTVQYNHLNLPKKFTFGANTIDILYDASGNKLRKTVAGTTNYTQEYIGGIEYRGTALEAIYTAEGRVFYTSPTTTRYEYTVKDHLGNARLSFSDVNANGTVDFSTEVLQENHYYPFGLGFDGNWKNDAALDNKYQYNRKEINDDFGLNWYNYGKRWYDQAIGRFPTVDPIASEFAFVTPYNYAENEPVAHIDLWGLQALYSANGGILLDRKEMKEGEKTPIYIVNELAKNFDPDNPWDGAIPLTYVVGGNSRKGGLTGDNFRSDHPLSGIGTCAGDIVYEEDILDLSADFFNLVASELPSFTGLSRKAFPDIKFRNMVTDDAKYDLKSSIVDDGTPSYSATVIGEWSKFFGTLRRYDDYGNISYGAFGREAGFSPSTLLLGSNINQWFKDVMGTTKGNGDTPRDMQMIKLGIILHRNGFFKKQIFLLHHAQPNAVHGL